MRGNGGGFEACEVVFEAPLLVDLCSRKGPKKDRHGDQAGSSTSTEQGAYIKTTGFEPTGLVGDRI